MNHLLPTSTAYVRQMIQTEGEFDNTLTVSGQAANTGAHQPPPVLHISYVNINILKSFQENKNNINILK